MTYLKKLLLLIAMLTCGAANAATHISLQSDDGDWIGGGQDHELSNDFDVSLSKNEISIQHPSGFNFLFVPPNDRDLEKGAYLLAERSPFRGPLNPGMDVGSTGKGCNNLNGEFYIYEMDYENGAQVLAMDFVQYCDSATDKLSGSIRIGSDIANPYPLPLPVVSTEASSILEGQSILLSGSKSLSKSSEIGSFYWEQVNGSTLSITSAMNQTTLVTVPDSVALGGEAFVLRLTVTDLLGQSDFADYNFNVKSKSDPQTYFSMISEAGDYIGSGQDWSYDLSSSTIVAESNADNGVSISITGSESWSADFVAPDDAQLAVGAFDYAERYPFQGAGVAGLNISGNGRGCNNSYGSFDITNLTWENNQPKAFKATFQQHCEQITAPLLTGEIAVNALHASVPVANAGLDIVVNERDVVSLNGSDSYDNLGSLASYEWRTAEALTISNSEQSRANFIAPPLEDMVTSSTFQVSLLVVDDEGFKAMDTVNVTVNARNNSPVAVNDHYTISLNQSVALSPLMNDADSDGVIQADSIIITQQPVYGTAIVDSLGNVNYTHTGSFFGEDSFAYTMKDNDGAVSNVSLVNISIEEAVVVTGDTSSNTSGDTSGNSSSSNGGGGGLSLWLILLFSGLLGFRQITIKN